MLIEMQRYRVQTEPRGGRRRMQQQRATLRVQQLEVLAVEFVSLTSSKPLWNNCTSRRHRFSIRDKPGISTT